MQPVARHVDLLCRFCLRLQMHVSECLCHFTCTGIACATLTRSSFNSIRRSHISNSHLKMIHNAHLTRLISQMRSSVHSLKLVCASQWLTQYALWTLLCTVRLLLLCLKTVLCIGNAPLCQIHFSLDQWQWLGFGFYFTSLHFSTLFWCALIYSKAILNRSELNVTEIAF